MEKICLIYQPCGLGDIFFIQKICNHWFSKGYKVILPVIHEYIWLKEYIKNVTFISWEDNEVKLTHRDRLPDNVVFPYKDYYNPYLDNIISEEFVYINLFKEPNGLVMKFKYDSNNLDYTDWSEYLVFERNKEKENDLYYNILGLKDDEEYVFVNRLYMMRPTISYYNRISNNSVDYNNKKVIELNLIDGFTLIDWLKVVENAKEINMIESSLNYLLETKQVNLKAEKLNLYSRINNFYEVDYLFKLNWNYII